MDSTQPTSPQPSRSLPANRQYATTLPQQNPVNPPTQPAQEIQPPPNMRESGLIPGQYVPLPEEIIFEWQAPSRPFKKRDRQYYTTIVMIVFLISLILFFAGQFLPIAVVIAIGFLSYVLASVPPDMVTNKITTYGIRMENDLHYWEELTRFWFEQKYGYQTLHMETTRFPGRIVMLLGNEKKEIFSQILSEVLPEQIPEPTMLDKASDWLQKTFPLEK